MEFIIERASEIYTSINTPLGAIVLILAYVVFKMNSRSA